MRKPRQIEDVAYKPSSTRSAGSVRSAASSSTSTCARRQGPRWYATDSANDLAARAPSTQGKPVRRLHVAHPLGRHHNALAAARLPRGQAVVAHHHNDPGVDHHHSDPGVDHHHRGQAVVGRLRRGQVVQGLRLHGLGRDRQAPGDHRAPFVPAG